VSVLALEIDFPTNGLGLAPGPVSLQGAVTGDATGLFFKWYSSLNAAATADNPELNTVDHSVASLTFSAPLSEFGSHVLVLAATDQDANDIASIKAVTRSAMAGGAPPAAPAPCVVHRVVAQIRTPADDGHPHTLSKAGATIEVLAPAHWAMPDPHNPGAFVVDTGYTQVNGIALGLRLAPVGAPDPAHTADIPLDLASLPFFRADDQTWFRITGPLPANLGTGDYTLTLTATGGGVSATDPRQVTLAP